MGNHLPRAMTTEILLESGNGLNHKFEQDGCSDSCAKL